MGRHNLGWLVVSTKYIWTMNGALYVYYTKEHRRFESYNFSSPISEFAKAAGVDGLVYDYVLPDGKSPKEVAFELVFNSKLNQRELFFLNKLIADIKTLNPVLAKATLDAEDFAQVQSFLVSVLYSMPPEDLMVALNGFQLSGDVDPILRQGFEYVDAEIRNRFYQERLGVEWGWTAAGESLKAIKNAFNVTSQWRLSQKKYEDIYIGMCIEAYEQAKEDYEAAKEKWLEVKRSRPLEILTYKDAPKCQ